MPFDKQRFQKASFEPRTDEVAVPGLADWFGDDEPIWRVRGMTHYELAKAAEAVERNRDMAAIVAALSGGTAVEKQDAMKELLGLDGSAPSESVKRLAYLVTGSVDPEVDHPLAVKLAHAYPIEFQMITNKIIELTGLGQVQALGKQKPSGKPQTSEKAVT